MSQILINSLSKVQETVANTMQTKASPLTSAMDKSTDFKNTLEKTLNKTEGTFKGDKVSDLNNAVKSIETEDSIVEPRTLGDIKFEKKSEVIEKDVDSTNVTLNAEELASLREILSQVSGEKNVETSLDLTLTKDVAEIIEQFKNAIANNKSEDDSTVEEMDEIQNILAAYLDNPSAFWELAKDLDSENLDLPKEVEALVEKNNLLELLQKFMPDAEKTSVVQNVVKLDASKEDSGSILLNNLQVSEENSEAALNDLINSMSNEVSKEIIAPKEDVLMQELDLPIEEDILKELNIEGIQAETSDSGADSFMQQQSAQEHVVKTMINQEIETFDIKIEKTMEAQPLQTAPAKVADANPSKILNQIVKQMEGMQNGSKVNIVLNPESLGKVNIQLLNTKDGLTAQLTVTTPEAKDALMKGLDNLKESLLSHGVNVDNVSVKMTESQKSSYNPDWTEQEGSRGGNKEQGRSNKDEKEKGLFEQMMAQANEENGNV